MGCCLSATDRGDVQSHNDLPNGINNSRELVVSRFADVDVDGFPSSGGGAVSRNDSQLRGLQSERDARRTSRRLPHDQQLQGDGLRLEEKMNRPLVRPKWTSRRPMTRAGLFRRREEYYDTRVTGRPEIWAALRLAIETMETDLATAQEIINASGITIPTGNLVDGAYDEFGTRYELPDYCVAEPRNLIIESLDGEKQEIGGLEAGDLESVEEAERRREEKGKKVIYANEEQYTVIVRLSDRGGSEADLVIKFTSSENVRSIVAKIMEKGKLKATQYRIRIAYLGRILQENQSLNDQGWKPGNVINALVLERF